MLCLVSALISYNPESRYVGVHLCLFFPLCVFILYSFSNHFVCFPTNNYELNLDSTLNITDVCLPFIVNHPVQLCVNTINIQNNLLMFLSAHYQPAISQLFIRLFLNMYVFCSSCHLQNTPVSLDVNLKEHKLQYIKSNSTCDSGLLIWQCYFF